MKSTAYEQAGVSLDAADEVVDKVKPLAQRTFRPGVIGGLGGFGGLFHLDPNTVSYTHLTLPTKA